MPDHVEKVAERALRRKRRGRSMDKRDRLFEDHFRSRNVYEFDPDDLERFEPGQERAPWM
ncbi:hypothetical protein [Streptomyces sp. IBSBF 2806]|uniref:hypothetical protein n=1 Tax=Streptomyces sp. IBSBF 2806 TaxID=2903529 RepID=UPI002FDBF758